MGANEHGGKSTVRTAYASSGTPLRLTADCLTNQPGLELPLGKLVKRTKGNDLRYDTSSTFWSFPI